jgi:putative thioredoxin
MPPPAEADPFEQAQALFDDGRYADAEAALVVMLNEDNTNAKALILYARCLTERGELGEAQTVLDAVKSDEHKAALAGAKAQI